MKASIDHQGTLLANSLANSWLMHGTNLYPLPTRCRHILPIFFFFEYLILRGVFFQNREKKHTFWRGEWGRISAPKTAEKKLSTLIEYSSD